MNTNGIYSSTEDDVKRTMRELTAQLHTLPPSAESRKFVSDFACMITANFGCQLQKSFTVPRSKLKKNPEAKKYWQACLLALSHYNGVLIAAAFRWWKTNKKGSGDFVVQHVKQ